MAKIKYREFLENLTNEIGYTPAHSYLSKILGGEVSANALSNRYSANGFLRPDEAEKITNFYRNKNRLGKEEEETIMLDYYPSVLRNCMNGFFTLSEIKEKISVPRKAFFSNYSKNKKYSVLIAQGNTMEPLIFDGDNVIIEHYNGGQIVDNRPYLFCYNDKYFIKRLTDNVNQLVIMPENRLYDIIKLTKEEAADIKIIGQVVGLMRDLR